MSITTIDLGSLTRKQNPTGSDILHLKDPLTGKDHYVLLSDIQTGTSYDSWDPETEYSIGDRVTFGFRLWESLQNTNEGNTPQEGAWWKEVSESAKPDKLERLINKTAHGFVAGNVLTLNGSGALVKVSNPSTEKFIGVVTEVVDVNNFRLVTAGYAELAGLTPGSLYYAQSDGTLGTTESDMLVLKADTAGGYILASSAVGGGGGPAIAGVYADIAALLADQGEQEENNYYWVTDASTDPTVTSGWAIYRKLAASTADLTDYVKVQEQESIDVTETPDWTDTTKGKVERAVQAEAETAADGTEGNRDNERGITARGWRWAWNAVKATAQTVTGIWTFGKSKTTHTAFGYATLTDGATINWDADAIGNIAQVTLGGNRTLAAITNPQVGGIYIIRIVQDGTGGRTLTWDAAYQFNQTPTINLSANGRSHFMFFYNGTNFLHISDFMKLSKGGNTDYETLTDSSDVYRFALLSRLGAVFKTLGMEWDETLGQLRFDGTTAIIRPGNNVAPGNFGIKIIEGEEDGFHIFDNNGDFIRFGVDADGRRKMFTSVPFKRLRGTAYLEDGFISEQVDASSTTDLRTIATETNSITTISIEAISVMNEDKDYIIGRAIFNFKNDAGTVSDISLTDLCYDEQYSTIKASDGYVTSSDTRLQCTIDGTNVKIQFINNEAKLVTVQCDIDYTVTPIPTS